MQNVSIIAQLKKSKSNNNTGTIIIRGFFNRKPAGSRSLGYKIDVDQWDTDSREVKSKAPNASLLNMNIKNKLNEIQNFLLKREIMGVVINRLIVMQAVLGYDDSKDFIQFCRNKIYGRKDETGKMVDAPDYDNKETRRTYNSECTKLEEFKSNSVITFADIDYSFLNGYKNYMRDTLHNEPNTIWKTFKFMNTMMEKAIKVGGIILENPFTKFNRGNYDQKAKEGIEIANCDNIEKIIHNNSHPEMLRKVGIYFLLMAYSGMRFGDAMRFDPDSHVVNGRLKMKYEKADTEVHFKIHKRLADIIDLVKVNRLKISNKEFNIWSKVIGGMIGVTMDMTSHRGRHTMGNLLVDLGVHEKVAQRILGHKDPRSTAVYFNASRKKIDRDIMKFDEIGNMDKTVDPEMN